MSRCGINSISYQTKLRLVETNNSEYTRPSMNPYFNHQFFCSWVTKIIDKLHHIQCKIYHSLSRILIMLSKFSRNIFFYYLQPAASHIRLPNSFNLLNVMRLAKLIKSSEYLIKNLNHLILAFFNNRVKLADITK
jgi:hypothetical protein